MNSEVQKEDYFVSNAGLTIVAYFLPQLFDALKLTLYKEFISDQAAIRAILLTQYLISGKMSFQEHDLILTKAICGVDPERSLPKSLKVALQETEEVERMLKAVIRNWNVLGNTSIEGLRESFLIRAGRLAETEKSWTLKMESKAIDVLLARIPWSISLIKLPWMKKIMYVE